MEGYKIFLTFLVIVLPLAYGRRVRNPCAVGKVPCDNGECIDRWDWCGNGVECTDRSDEKYCDRKGWFNKEVTHICTEKHFTCGDGMCMPASLRCDGENDCYDGSDEQNCDKVDQDQSLEKEPDYFSTTTTPAQRREIPTTALPISTDVYDRRRAEQTHYNNRRRDYTSPPSNTYDPYVPLPTANPNYNYGRTVAPPSNTYDPYVPLPTANPNYNYGRTFDARYPEQNNNRRGSDTVPGGNFPNNRSPRVPETTPYGRPYRPTTTSRPDYPYAGRGRPEVLPPRSILYPPRTTLTITPRRTVRRPRYAPFYFASNYTGDFGRKYRTNIRNAKDWLLSQRDASYGWDRNTARGLIALSLISNSFQSDVEDNELMRKGLQTHLGIKILRNETGIEKISTTRLAVYIHALLATCQDPRDFWGIDLAKVLGDTQNHLEQNQRFVNPLIYLSLCLTDMPVNIGYLRQFLRGTFPTEISKDLHILAMTAMACVAQQHPHDNYIRTLLDEAALNLLTEMNRTDGSFGNKYNTALAAQALMSVNTSLRWDAQKTMDYLARQQIEDGSFGDMQATYYAILALSGRSLVHLRNTLCDPENIDEEEPFIEEGPRKSVFYTLRIGYPETFSTGIQLSVPLRMNFFDIMRVAARQDPRFKFSYEISKGHYGVHTIANIPSDPERGMFWTLYWLPSSARDVDLRRRYLHGVNELVPNDGDEVIFWYLSEF